ncbi:MAG: hypothetical protein K2N15_15755 [Lachnospiraceae bacterium]|nr:hypothetical protein [Lachnospiraceae bacterium]
MNHRSKLLFRLAIVLFSVSISTAVIPGGLINTYGLFGEVKSSTVTDQNRKNTEELTSTFEKSNTTKGINIYNIWFWLVTIIIFLIFTSYMIRLPRSETIVTLKVRMDN